jgi:hypothetical protein
MNIYCFLMDGSYQLRPKTCRTIARSFRPGRKPVVLPREGFAPSRKVGVLMRGGFASAESFSLRCGEVSPSVDGLSQRYNALSAGVEPQIIKKSQLLYGNNCRLF